jgi:hypothetical protein
MDQSCLKPLAFHLLCLLKFSFDFVLLSSVSSMHLGPWAYHAKPIQKTLLKIPLPVLLICMPNSAVVRICSRKDSDGP